MSGRAATIAAFIGLVLYGLLLASILLILYGFVLLLRDSSPFGTITLFGGIAILFAVLLAYSKLYQGWKKTRGQ
jgi:membrane-bound ClpP family serine protease